MSSALRFFFVCLLACSFSAAALAQPCHDRDGDLADAGLSCNSVTDCDDGSWDHRPGAEEVCSGFDTDCDGSIDESCDRFCDSLDLFDIPLMLEFGENYPIPDDSINTTMAVEFFAGGFLAIAETGTLSDKQLSARAFDAHGAALSRPFVIDSSDGSYSLMSHCDITRGDARHLVVWERAPPFDPADLMARVIDRFGAPVGPILDISHLSGSRRTRGVTEFVGAFNGNGFAFFWSAKGASNELLMTTIGYDGTPESVGTVLVTDDVNGQQSVMDHVRSVWTGDRYIVTLRAGEQGNFITLSVDPAGSILSGPHVHSFRGSVTELIMSDDGPVAAILYQQQPSDWIDFVFLDAVTADLRPPGRVVLSSSENIRASGPRVVWNGEIFAVTTSDREWNGVDYDYGIWAWRVLPSGVVLDPLGVKLDNGENWRSKMYKIGWNGERFEIMAKFINAKLARVVVICDCGDADGDLFDACETDCNDSNLQINSIAAELCTGGIDDDCDDLVDCADPECPGGTGPAAVQDLAWSDASLVWTGIPDAQRYDLARGLLSDALRRGDFTLAECAGHELTMTSWHDDGRRPPVGDLLWYLVRTEGEPCFRGRWSADGVPRDTLVCD